MRTVITSQDCQAHKELVIVTGDALIDAYFRDGYYHVYISTTACNCIPIPMGEYKKEESAVKVMKELEDAIMNGRNYAMPDDD